jgi:hypothetical protein
MSHDSISDIEARAKELLEAGDPDAAWPLWRSLLDRLGDDRDAALSVLRIVEDHAVGIDRATEALKGIFDAYEQDMEIIARIGECIQRARDIDDLNAPPPGGDLFPEVLERLAACAVEVRDADLEILVLSGLAHTARLMSRQHDDIAERSYRRLVELLPQRSYVHYNLGLFFKTRGRFREGIEPNQAAMRLAKEPEEAHLWNLGICATGAGEGMIALGVWRQLGQKVEIGRFGLPDGGYPSCKVKLAQRPLAERNAANDDPGLEETIWIERLSPCHGIVRSVLYQDLGVDYGDVVLIDGAPITHHRYGDDEIPVFPHLATLQRRGYQFFDFAGVQNESGQLRGVSAELDDDAVVYSHTEAYHVLCAACWRDPTIDHQHENGITEHVVLGRIAAPQHADTGILRRQVDAAVGARSGCEIYSPALSAAAGLDERAAEEKRRFDLLRHSGPAT